MKSNPYLIGIDVASQKADVDIHDPDDKELGKFQLQLPNKQLNNTMKQITALVDKNNTIVVMEATGTYHRIFLYGFLNRGFKVVIVNPYQANSFQRAASLRKTVTDKISAHTLITLYRLHHYQVTDDPEANMELKKIVKTYYTLIDTQSGFKKRVKSILAEIFPLVTQAFSNIFSKTAVLFLKCYHTPDKILTETPEKIFRLLKNTARKNSLWAAEKLDAVMLAARMSPSVEKARQQNIINLLTYLTIIENIETQIQLQKQRIEEMAQHFPQIKLLMSIPGIGPILSATILGEIGNFNRFTKLAQLVAFAGIDPSVKQSGKFNSSRNRMSKRGSRLLRRALYLAACCAIKRNRAGLLVNPYLHQYYQKKLAEGKPKKVALGACMHKITAYIFATLRDNKKFSLIDPNKHKQWKKAA
jgi:transposase